ncbi:radical SAM protein [Anaerosporobacter sp.]|uniref:radical SAM protein n=1 Tax=Anaerosporobacter sp. TaxID=1872529 RepID=UPI00286F9ADC|nr:radical SAM protein [Anaerosporobacter sp.]
MPHCNKQMISFFLTTKCRLRCKYCYNQEEREKLEEKSLSFEVAKAGIDEYFSNNNSRHIRFYGPGEPTEEFELMQQITKYARQKEGSVTVTTELQTNGTFNPAVREWILNNINIIWISFDGTPEFHDKQRPFPNDEPSSPIIEDNIRWLLNNKGDRNLMIGGRVTVTDLNNNHQKQMIDYFMQMGIDYVWSDPEFPPVGIKPFCDDKGAQDKYHFDMDTYVNNYIEAYRYAKQVGMFYGSFLICNFDSNTKINCRCCTPVPHLTPDGYISACDLVVFGTNANHMDCFIYGKFDELTKKIIYYPEKIKTLQNRNSDNLAHCKACPAKLHCSGYCPGEIVNETGKLDGIKPFACKAVKKLYKELYAEIQDDLKGGLFMYPHP